MGKLRYFLAVLALLSVGALFGGSLYDTLVLAPNLQRGPEGLEHGRLFTSVATPGYFFRAIAPASQILLVLAVVASWRSTQLPLASANCFGSPRPDRYGDLHISLPTHSHKQMLKVPLILTGLAISLLCPLTAYACSCAAPPSKEEQERMLAAPEDPEFKRWWREEFKGAVFIGTVIKIQKVDVKWLHGTTRMKKVEVNVERAWFGVNQQTFVIYTSLGKGGDCGVPYSKGYKYFFLADVVSGLLWTNICSPTDPDNYKAKLFDKTFGDGRSFLRPAPR